jgi:hypothetical protein
MDGARLALALEPHGLQFATPAILSMPHDGTSDSLVILRAGDPAASAWAPIGRVDRTDETASVEIDGFSGQALSAIPDGACPCMDGRHVRAARVWADDNGGTCTSEGYHPFDEFVYNPARLSCEVGGTQAYFSTGNSGPVFDCRRGIIAASPESEWEALYGDTDWTLLFPGTTDHLLKRQELGRSEWASVQACEALLIAGGALVLSASARITATGLGAEVATVSAGASGEQRVEDGENDPFRISYDETTRLSANGPPAGQTCTFDASGTTELDLTPTSAAVIEMAFTCTGGGSTEDPCDGVDDDGDGQVDENRSTDDADGDGLVDECDTYPELDCDRCYQVEEVAGFLDVVGTASWQEGLTLSDGRQLSGWVKGDATSDSIDVAGTVRASDGSLQCIMDCLGDCTGAGHTDEQRSHALDDLSEEEPRAWTWRRPRRPAAADDRAGVGGARGGTGHVGGHHHTQIRPDVWPDPPTIPEVGCREQPHRPKAGP